MGSRSHYLGAEVRMNSLTVDCDIVVCVTVDCDIVVCVTVDCYIA